MSEESEMDIHFNTVITCDVGVEMSINRKFTKISNGRFIQWH